MIGGATTNPTFPFNPNQEAPVLRFANWIHYIRNVGQELEGDTHDFRDKLVKYAAKNGFQLDYT